jgi:hypothetical protein
MTSHVLSNKQPAWVEAPPPPQFAQMIGRAWYYKVDCFYLALLFTSKQNPDRCMAIYHLKGEENSRQEKYDTVEIGMTTVQRILSENTAHVRVWGVPEESAVVN